LTFSRNSRGTPLSRVTVSKYNVEWDGAYPIIIRRPFTFRRFWFVDGGRRIGVNLGAMHGPGLNLLLDALTGKELARFPDADLKQEPTPRWLDADAGA
jgi:hypothetical protein